MQCKIRELAYSGPALDDHEMNLIPILPWRFWNRKRRVLFLIVIVFCVRYTATTKI